MDDRVGIQATVTTAPMVPWGISPQNATGHGVLTLQSGSCQNDASSTTCATCINRWYGDLVSPTYLGTGPSFTTPDITTSTTYYISTYNSATSCESGRWPVYTTVLPYISPSALTTEVVRVSGITQDTQLYALTDAQQNTSMVYFDGLQRANQTLSVRSSPLGKDVVQPVEYDQFGRTSRDYLPYVATTTDGSFHGSFTSEQASFYNNSADKIADDATPFAVATYENSPLGRVTEQGSVGQAWQPGTSHTKRMGYSFNIGGSGTDAEEVRQFNSDGTSSGFFPANYLSRTSVIDENGNTDIVYKDVLGRTLASKQQLDGVINSVTVNYLQTYYIYDDLNHLKYIIPPGGVAVLRTNGWNLAAILDQHVHQFVYDQRGRLTQKKTPGQAWSYFAYDKLNRLVLTQDGNLRPQNQWAFVKYDSKGRTVMSGIYTNAAQTTLALVQGIIDGQYTGSNPYYEDRGTALHGYTNQSFPTLNADNSALQILTVNYFDSYDFDFNGSDDQAYDNTLAPGTSALLSPYGFATGSKRLVLGQTIWLYSYVFYNNDGRTIQTRSNNHKSAAVDNTTTVIYDPVEFGKVVQTITYHNAGGTNQVTVSQKPIYDSKGRVTNLKHSINGAADQTVTQYNYNELGQVVMKQLHNTAGNYLQNVDYRYNIKGWLTSINNAQLTSDGVTNNDTNDYFGMEMSYNTDAGMSNTPYFNGNVSAVKWKGLGTSAGATGQRSYKFAYDKTDKLTTATFQAYGTAWNIEASTLDELMTYDHNGNILTLSRNQNLRGLSGATVTATPQTIDNLTYTYASGNQLSNVSDAASATAGFKDAANATSVTEYTYDTHGNMYTDLNKGISNIIYNALGKAQQITFSDGRVINYTYDAAGNKLTMAATVSGTTTTTDYVNGFVYNTVASTSTLNFFSSPEGRVVKNGSNFEYQYTIADHQGNTRVLFTSAAPITQSATATFETINQPTEQSEFNNYTTNSAYIDSNPANAHNGNNSLKLNGGYAGVVGVAMSYKVFPGDQLHIDGYAKVEAPCSTCGPSGLANFAPIILGAFNLATPAPGEVGTPSAGINSWATVNSLYGYGDGSTDNTDPKVFVTIAIFDKNYNFLDVAYSQLKSDGSMSADYTAKEAGYAFMYVSNEIASPTYVYFDDITIKYTPTNVIQSNEYYPFGLQTANSWTRDNSNNNFLYNDGSELNNTSGFYDLPFRNYDATLGRFFQVDPMATTSHTMTPYHYAGNNPIGYNDPTGLFRLDAAGVSSGVDPYYSSWFADDRSKDNSGGTGGAQQDNTQFWKSINLLFNLAPNGNTQIYGKTASGDYGFMATPAMYFGIIKYIGLNAYVNSVYAKTGVNITSLLRPVPLDEMGASLDDSWKLTQGDGLPNGLYLLKAPERNPLAPSGIVITLGYIGDGNLNWVQTVSTNLLIDGTRGSFQFVDGHDLPYFWSQTGLDLNTGDNAIVGGNQFDILFKDDPNRGSATNFYWQAELSIVQINSNGTNTILQTVGYGFSVNSAGALTINPFQNNITPSAFHLNAVNGH